MVYKKKLLNIYSTGNPNIKLFFTIAHGECGQTTIWATTNIK